MQILAVGGYTILKTEHEEQREFVSWFRKNYEEWIFAIPNGGKRGKVEAAKLRVEGVTAGVPDLYIPAFKLWIEMKRVEGGTVSKEQKNWKKYLLGIGDSWMLAKGFEEAKHQLLEFKAPTRSTPLGLKP
jgi:hypothetical protein